MTKNTNDDDTIETKATNDALKNIGNLLIGERGAKKKEREAQKEQAREERLARVLESLNLGDPTRKDGVFYYRKALTKTASALRWGATVEQLQACHALQKSAPWSQVEGPIREFAKAAGVDPDMMVAGLTAPEKKTAEPKAAPKAPKAAPKAAPKRSPKSKTQAA